MGREIREDVALMLLPCENSERTGAGCGDCDSNGKSGTGIFNVDTPDDCVESVYACNEDASRQRAQARAAEIGVLVD